MIFQSHHMLLHESCQTANHQLSDYMPPNLVLSILSNYDFFGFSLSGSACVEVSSIVYEPEIVVRTFLAA